MPGIGHLYRRIYLHGVVLLALVALALGVAGALLGRGVVWRGHPERLASHVASLLPASNDAAAVAPDVRRLGRELGVELAVYREDGSLLGAAGPRTLPALPPEELRRLGAAGVLHSHFVVSVEAGMGRYLRLALRPPEGAFPGRALGALLLVVLVLAVGSLPLARGIARPLESLGQTARRLGEGDLTVRSGIRRGDEIGALARAFDEMADRLQRLLEGQRELLASASHELRTPMARMRVSLGLAAEAEGERARAYLDEIDSDLGELERLVQDVLTAARLEATGATPVTRARLDPGELLREAVHRLSRLDPARRLELSLEGPLPALTGDPNLLGRVLDNVLDNARMYSDASEPIALVARRAQDQIEIEVRDRGIGIDPADHKHLFTPFFRTDRSRARHTGGVGLGLALSKKIVESHGGRLWLESRPGEGTTVQVWLSTV